MARFAVLRIVPLALVVLSATAEPVRASVITTGDVAPGGAGTKPDPWTLPGTQMHIGGWSTTGTITISSGGRVENLATTIFDGTATISGFGSTWDNSDIFSVGLGPDNEGTVTIENGGRLENQTGYIGSEANSKGTVTVTGENSIWDNSGSFYVGRYGEGTITIENRGRVENTNGYIGIYSGASGTFVLCGERLTNPFLY